MATIKNNRENNFDFAALINGELKTETLQAGLKEGDKFTPTEGEISDDLLQALSKNQVVGSWFDSGALEVIDAPKSAKPAAKAAAPAA